MKKAVIVIGILVVTAVLGFFVFNAYIYNEKQADPNAVVEPYQATLTGTQVCLPHKGDGPHTKECATGIKTDAGEFYAMDFTLMSQFPAPDFGDKRFIAQGVITPVEFLSSDQWQKYDIVGILSVTNMKAVDEQPTATGPIMTAAVISLGQSALTQGLTIVPIEVVSDSRCPSDVQCIWAGELVVKTKLTTFTSSQEFTLTLGSAQEFENYTVRLIDASPATLSTKPISPAEYRLTYEVVKNN